MAMRALHELYAHFVSRTDFLVRKFEAPLASDACIPIHADGRMRMLIRLQHLWAEFCRELVTRSALGGCQTLSGRLLGRVSGVSDWRDIERTAWKESNRRPPPWHQPKFTLGVANKLAVQNLAQISLGLGAVSPADDLTDIRNYIVHPNERTKLAYNRVTYKLGARGLEPDMLLTSRQIGGATLFEAWVAELQTVAFNAIR